MALFLPRRGGIQPQYRPRIDWSHPLARGLVMCPHPGAGVGGWIDLAAPRTITTWTGTLANGPVGTEFAFSDASSQNLRISQAAIVAGSAFSFFIEANPTPGFAGTFGCPVSISNASDTMRRIVVNGTTGATAFQVISGGTGSAAGPGIAFTGSWYGLCGVQDSNTRRRLYANGVAGADNTTSVTGAMTPDRTSIGCYSGAIDQYFWDGRLRRLRIYNRALSNTEVLALTANPDAMLYTPRGVLYFLSSGASSGNTIAAPKGALTLTGFAPTVAATANQTIAVPKGALTLTGLAPTVTAAANQTVAVPKGALTLTGNAPTVTVGNAQTVAVPAGALTLTGNAPTVVTTANQTIAVPAGSLSLTGNAPTVVVGDQQIVLVPAGVLNITGFAPVVIAGGPVVVSVPAGSLSLTGYAPTVDTGGRRNNAAGKAKRRKYEIQGKTYALTPGELEQVLSLVMREEEPEEEAPKVVVKAVKEVAKAVAAVPVEAPTYEANPAFDALWADMTRQHEHEAAESLRVIAQQIHEKAIFDDDQDILDIIALIP